MSKSRPTVLFVDSHTWEAFSAMAGALRANGMGVKHVVARRNRLLSRAVQLLDFPLYSTPIFLVHGPKVKGGSATIDEADLEGLITEDIIDVQAHDDLVPVLMGIGDPLTDPSRHLGPGIDPAVLSDKWVQGQFATDRGIPTPKFWQEPKSEEFPVVMKTRVGFAGTGVRIVKSAEDLPQAWDELSAMSTDPPFLQEFKGQRVVDSAGVAHEGEILVYGAYRTAPAPNDPTGPSLDVETIEAPELEEHTKRFIKELGYSGFFNIDWVLDSSDEPWMIDFNPRIFGSWAALQEAGADFIGAYFYLLGVGAKPQRQQMTTGQTLGLLRFPFPVGTSRADALEHRREALRIIKVRKAFLGSRWAAVSRLKTEAALLQAIAGLSNR